MSRYSIIFAIMCVLAAGCVGTDNKGKIVMEDISVDISGIAFTKAINNGSKCYEVTDGGLVVEAGTKTNYFIAPDGGRSEATAPILLTEVDNRKPFTFTTRVESGIEKIYDAAAVYVFVDNSDWLKYAFECDEKYRHRVVTVRTKCSSDDNNHDIIARDHVWFRISSNGRQIGFYYSPDGVEWNLARLFRNDYPAKVWLGVSSQSPKEGGNVSRFSEMSLVQSYISDHRLGE